MKSVSSFVVPLAASFLLACGAGTEPVADESEALVSTPSPEQSGQVSAQACTTLYRPRYSSYWESFPIQVDGQVGGCETNDDCTVSCWGEQNNNAIHSGFFYCTYCY
ncbi:hypothetical protein JRI60_02760 [Archangium violaceum]|uniref:hypothetical protein n=1 Tax=Archangium violaceum TaxID=83451 RepID=UPI001950EA47|nr:hypothetical protein [Archangium violaceum]QRN98013.1 hypothetical protein JRI60_02760 [Archangium violaceum]